MVLKKSRIRRRSRKKSAEREMADEEAWKKKLAKKLV